MLLCVRIARSTTVKVDDAALDMSRYHQAVLQHQAQICFSGETQLLARLDDDVQW